MTDRAAAGYVSTDSRTPNIVPELEVLGGVEQLEPCLPGWARGLPSPAVPRHSLTHA
jgi:hypothetical protein